MNTKKVTAIILVISLCFSLMLAIASAQSQQASTYTAYGPIGTGPYIYMGTDPETGAIKLVRNENYWNKEALQQTGVFGVQELDLQYINGSHAVVAALSAGKVSIVSPYYRIDDVSIIEAPWGDYFSAYAGDVSHMELNLQHPVFGTGIETPLGQANFSRAAEAARYVRQAISHLIPRQEIVETIFGGVAMPGVISSLSPMTTGFDATLEPYLYDVTLARQLLEQAGYDTAANNSILFHMTLLVGEGAEGNNAVAQLVQSNLNSVGIAVDISVVNFNVIVGKLYPDSISELGKTFNQGGFDAGFITYSIGTNSTPYYAYHSSQFPPVGGNCNLWNNTENDRLCSLIEHTTNETERIEYLKQWQQLFYNEQPTMVIACPMKVIAFNPAIIEKGPFEVYFPSVWPVAENWVLKQADTQAKIVMAIPQAIPLDGFNPYIAGNAYDYDVISEVFESLVALNDSTSKTIVPALATSWESSADQTTWTVHLRQNVTWHDGVKFNATDVKFSYDTAMNKVGSEWLKDNLGSADNIAIIDEYTLEFILPIAHPTFVGDVLSISILPSHVLQDVAYENWATHPFNTAANSYTVTLPQATTSPTAAPTAAPTFGFFDQYGSYTIAIAIVIIIVLIVTAAILIFKQHNKHKTKHD